MDVEKILEEVKADPAKLEKLVKSVKDGDIQKALKEHGIDLEPEKAVELGKKLLAEGGGVLDSLKNNEAVKDALEKGGDLLKDLLGGKKE